jgi:hypothetical protein
MLVFAVAVGVVGAVFGATTQWFQRALQAVWSAIPAVSWPSLPSVSDLASLNPIYWVILLVVGLGVIAGAAVVGWAFKEDS